MSRAPWRALHAPGAQRSQSPRILLSGDPPAGKRESERAIKMPVTVLVPGPLRLFAGGRSEVVIDPSPSTLADVLESLGKVCPGIRDRLMTEQGRIREHINVFVGTEDVRHTGGLQTPIPEGSQITILPSISGGKNRRPTCTPVTAACRSPREP